MTKVLDLPSFARALTQTYGLLDPSSPSVALLIAVVVAVEAVVLVQSFEREYSNRARRFIACVLIAMSGHLLVSLIVGRAGCGCFGSSAWLSPRAEAALGLVRNVALFVCLVSTARQEDSTAVRRPQSSAEARAFTLLEMLVTIAVIAVLLAITFPVLAHARAAARVTRTLSNARSLPQAIAAYTTDYTEAFPYICTPGRLEPGSIQGQQLPDNAPYFKGQGHFWISLLIPGYLAADPAYISGWGPPVPPGAVSTPFYLTLGTAATPRYWTGDFPLGPFGHLRGQRTASVVHAGRKALLAHYPLIERPQSGLRPHQVSVSACDGSAATRDLVELSDVARQRSRTVWRYTASSFPQRGLATEGGLAGIDY